MKIRNIYEGLYSFNANQYEMSRKTMKKKIRAEMG